MVAVPLCGRRRVIGLLEAFCSWPFGFNDSDVRNLSLLAELVVEIHRQCPSIIGGGQAVHLRAKVLLLSREVIGNVLCERIGHVLVEQGLPLAERRAQSARRLCRWDR
jgi:hypothetical protein